MGGVNDLIEEVYDAGGKFVSKDGRLEMFGKRLPEDLKARIREHRVELARLTSGLPMIRKIAPPYKSQPSEQPELCDGQDAGRVFRVFTRSVTRADEDTWPTDKKQ